jgi:hypothetical protein
MRFRYAFRGQASVDWGLATHIQRAALRGDVDLADLDRLEAWILHEFRRRAHHFIDDPPGQEDLLDWLALIQHHGGPTRLLDFTYAFYAAAFFAVDTAEADAAIWAIDLQSLAEAATPRAGFPFVPFDRRDRITLHTEFCRACLDKPMESTFVLDVEPFRMNPRMADQQGLFLFPTVVTAPFEDTLFATFGVDASAVKGENPSYTADDRTAWPHVAKIILPHHLHGTAIDDLHTMNVSAVSLFGGLDGLARSMNRFMRPFVEDEWRME